MDPRATPLWLRELILRLDGPAPWPALPLGATLASLDGTRRTIAAVKVAMRQRRRVAR